MKAVLRLGTGFAVATGLALSPTPLRAQNAAQSEPAPTTVGPAELQNFSINGTVTTPAAPRPSAQQPPQQQPTRPETRPSTPADRPAATTPVERPSVRTESPVRTPVERRVTAAPSSEVGPATPSPRAVPPVPAPSVTVDLPALDRADRPATATPTLPASPEDGGPSSLLWLLAAAIIGGGAAFLWWQRRSTSVVADGPAIDAYVPPAPTPTPMPRPAPSPASAPVAQPVAPEPASPFVSTRLRPWMELGFSPRRCTIEDDRVLIDFDVEVQNSGNAPARAVLVEARMVNAGATQDQEIGDFFANPVGQGERIAMIDPLKSIRLSSRIVTGRDQVQVYEVGGRQVFVPLLAFNVLYEWSRGQGQTSASFLVGRDTKGEKLAPFRLDLGPRLFRTLSTRPLPLGVRQ